jgi:phage shock protein PspC (stress-responsive transcriptional regulator)
MEPKRLYKSTKDKAIFGVCGGLAEYFGIDSIIVRLVVVLFTLAFGSGLLFYIIAALIMPKAPEGGYYEQPAQPGAYNAGGTVYVNRASQPYEPQAQNYSYAASMPQEVARAAAPAQAASAEPAKPAEPASPAQPARETEQAPQQAEPLSEVEKAWKAEHNAQLRRMGKEVPEEPLAKDPKTEAKPAQSEPKPAQEAPKAEPRPAYEPTREAPHAASQQSQQSQRTYQVPPQQTQRTYQAPPAHSSGDRTRTVLGLALIFLGVLALVKVFLPRLDMRILFAIIAIALGGVLIAKRN